MNINFRKKTYPANNYRMRGKYNRYNKLVKKLWKNVDLGKQL